MTPKTDFTHFINIKKDIMRPEDLSAVYSASKKKKK